MNKGILTAAVLMGLGEIAHVFMGGPEVHIPMAQEVTDPYLNAFVPIIWHAITVVLAVLTAGLFWLAFNPNRPLEAVFAAIQFGFAALFLYYGVPEFGTAVFPQWILFTLVPVLTFFAMRRAERLA